MSCVRESLGKFNFLPSLDFDTNRTLDIPAYLADNKPDMPYLTHNELIERIFQKYRDCDKKKYTSLFLSSLSSNKLNYRSGLPDYEIGKRRVGKECRSRWSPYH